MDYLKLRYNPELLNLWDSAPSWHSKPTKNIHIALEETPTREQLTEEIVPVLKEVLHSLVFAKEYEGLFRYKVKAILDFRLRGCTYYEEFTLVNEPLREELKARVNRYVEEVIFGTRPIKQGFEIYILMQCLVDFPLMGYSYDRVKEIINHILEVLPKEKHYQEKKDYLVNSATYYLRAWEKEVFRPLYFDIEKDDWSDSYTLKADFDPSAVDAAMLDFFVYSAYISIRYKNGELAAKDNLELAAKEFHSETAARYLKEGTGAIPAEELHYDDADLKATANDIFACMTLTVKQEGAEAYRKGLAYITNLLQRGFPASYHIALKGKGAKCYLPVKGLAKSATHHFFANALQYPELYPALEAYARVAMQEFAWYEDVEDGEKAVLPGTYAVMGLGLVSEAYFPLLTTYFQTVDEEHQMAQLHYIDNLIERYGITEASFAVICAGILSSQSERKYKALKAFFKDKANLPLLEKELAKYEDYEQEAVRYAVGVKV